MDPHWAGSAIICRMLLGLLEGRLFMLQVGALKERLVVFGPQSGTVASLSLQLAVAAGPQRWAAYAALKAATVAASLTASGILFHSFGTHWEKKFFLTSSLFIGILSPRGSVAALVTLSAPLSLAIVNHVPGFTLSLPLSTL